MVQPIFPLPHVQYSSGAFLLHPTFSPLTAFLHLSFGKSYSTAGESHIISSFRQKEFREQRAVAKTELNWNHLPVHKWQHNGKHMSVNRKDKRAFLRLFLHKDIIMTGY